MPIEALEPGIEGNVRANTINTVSGALRFRVRVINPTGTGGGGAQLVRVVTQQDKDNLLAQVQASLEQQALSALQATLEPGEWLPPESVQTFTDTPAFDKFNDDEGDKLSLTLRVLVQGTALNQEQTNDAVLAALRNQVPANGRLVADTRCGPPRTGCGRGRTHGPIHHDRHRRVCRAYRHRGSQDGRRRQDARRRRWHIISRTLAVGPAARTLPRPGVAGTMPPIPNRIQVRRGLYRPAMTDAMSERICPTRANCWRSTCGLGAHRRGRL